MWGMRWLKKDMVVGKVRWFLPYVGYVTIVMVSWVSQRIHRTHTQGSLLMFWCLFLQNDFPQLKYALLGVLGFFLLVNKEQ